jgi:hypothetical protein
MRLAILAALLVVFPASSRADRDTTAVIAPKPPTFIHIEIAKDGTKEATFVQPRADGMVGYLTPDSTMEYVSMYRVRRITDPSGADVTAHALRRREWLGAPPPRPVRPPSAWKSCRLRAGPRIECGSFPITESSVVWTAPTAGYAGSDEQRYQGVDYGYARNISSMNSLGGSLFLAADGARTHAGLRVRLYHWLAPNVSLDLSPGVILFGNEEGNSSFVFPGFSGQAGLMLAGSVGVMGQVVSVRRRWSGHDETETNSYIGFRLGATPGIIGSGMLLIAGLNELSTPEVREIR